jgi:hypothetical protein
MGGTMAQQEIDLSTFYPTSLKIAKVTNMKKEINIFMKSQTHMQTCRKASVKGNLHQGSA